MTKSNIDGTIFAIKFDGKGKGIEISGDDISKEIKDKNLAWVHMDASKKETRSWLKKEASYLDDIILDALLADETRPRVLEINNGILLILRGMNLNENADPEDMISIRIWVDQNRIISLERRPLKATRDIKENLLNNIGPKNSADFLAFLTSRLFERMEPILTELDEHTDNIEERILENPEASERQEIMDIRRQAIIFRRYILPQKDAMQYLLMSNIKWLDEISRRRLHEANDRLTRYIEDLESIRERTQVVKDELTNMLSDKLNKNLYLLSVIAAIFLPLGFLTGLLGINVGGIPGTDNPNSFWIFSGILTFLVFVQLYVFRKLGWI